MESAVNLAARPSCGQFDAIAFDAGKADFQRVAFRADGIDVDRWPGRLGRGNDGFGGEVEGDAKNVGILDGEEAVRRRGRRTGGGGHGQ